MQAGAVLPFRLLLGKAAGVGDADGDGARVASCRTALVLRGGRGESGTVFREGEGTVAGALPAYGADAGAGEEWQTGSRWLVTR
nr:unnamed protein product [Digitaria exilis]